MSQVQQFRKCLHKLYVVLDLFGSQFEAVLPQCQPGAYRDRQERHRRCNRHQKLFNVVNRCQVNAAHLKRATLPNWQAATPAQSATRCGSSPTKTSVKNYMSYKIGAADSGIITIDQPAGLARENII